MSAKPQTVDWFRLLWDLVQRGWSVRGVSEKVDIPPSTLYHYMRGSHPNHWRGEDLILLWCQACAKQRDELPMCDVYTAPRVVEKRGPNWNDQAARALDALTALERGMR